MTETKDLRNWLFKSILFEADSERFRQAGIQIGADNRTIEESLLNEALTPFPLHLRKEAVRMSRIYALMNCFENSMRELIRDRLISSFPADWWNSGVPEKIRRHAESRKQDSQKNSWLQGEKGDLLLFVDFGHLGQIIIAKWDLFSDLLPSQAWLTQRMEELEKARNFIAHNRILSQTEYSRIEMYINDWNAQVGV